MNNLTHVGLFEGSGIPSLAAASAGIKTVAYSETDQACCYALARLWPDAIALGDVKTADWSLVPQPVFILTAGVPCQPVSTAGRQKGKDDERWLWPETVRAVRALRPRWVLFENPRSIILHGLERIVAELEGIGYDFIPKGYDGRFAPLCIGADDVGAPHRRKRVWIVGRLDDAARDRHARETGDGACQERQAEGRDGRNRQAVGWLHQPVNTVRDGDVAHPPRHGQRGEPAPERADRERTGEAGDGVVADASQQRQREPHDTERPESRSGDARQDAGGGGRELGDPIGPRLAGRQGQPRDDGSERAAAERTGGIRWPARPGERQHEWEAPRLVEFGVGSPANELARRIHASLDGRGNGVSPDRAASKANKSLLRMLGNGWAYPLSVILFRAIVELDKQLTSSAE